MGDPEDGPPCAVGPAHTAPLARWSLGWLALVQLAAGAPPLVLGQDPGTSAHLARHIGSFDVAIAVGLLLVAWRPARARAMLPVVAALAACVMGTALLDLADGATRLDREVAHVPEPLAVAFVWALAGTPRRRRREPTPSVVAPHAL